MITFKEESYIVEVKTAGNPIEDYLGLQQELLELMNAMDEHMEFRAWRTLELLKQMMVDYETGMKMFYAKDMELKKLKELALNTKAC